MKIGLVDSSTIGQNQRNYRYAEISNATVTRITGVIHRKTA